ncbi:MAG: DNA replication/repair protein RecF [Chloroflexota bacterium]|nr:DNA replication/repair protein RecF [Chloroflexota bacterium]
MYVKRLSLENFRNYADLDLELPRRINILQGQNAQGKTNFLEIFYYLSTTKSPRASTYGELMRFGAHEEVIPHTDIEALFVRGGEEHTLGMTIVKEPIEGTQDFSFHRRIELNGVEQRAFDVVGRLGTVLFFPEDITIVSGAPSERRRYMDILLCQIDARYCQALSRYNRVIRQRNALLRQVRENRSDAGQLGYWDEQLAGLAALVLARRFWATRELDAVTRQKQRSLTGDAEELTLTYESTLAESSSLGEQQAWYKEDDLALLEDAVLSRLEEVFLQTLRRIRDEEIERGITLIGPHRDDLRFWLNGVDATTFASRGQQRTVALALKLAEVALMRGAMGEMPVLLLDDVLSELDQQRSRLLLDTISRAQQVFVTTTDVGYFSPAFLESAVTWEVAGGTITPLE